MNLNNTLLILLEHLESTGESIVVDWDSTQEWTVGVLDKLVAVGILAPIAKAQSLECHGCEYHCFKELSVLQGSNELPTRAFIVCDVPEMQSQMGRIPVPLERLQQWQCSIKQIAEVIAKLLNFDNKLEHNSGQKSIKLGMLKGGKGRRWISLNTESLVLEINQRTIPINESIFFEDEELVIDNGRINDILKLAPILTGKPYTPSKDAREARKHKTQAMYQDWNDAYLALKKKHPYKSSTWFSQQIAKMDIAQGRKADTIRKNINF